MRFVYDNSTSPWSSQTSRDFSPALDCIAQGHDAIELSVVGEVTDDPEPMYLQVSDGAGTAQITCPILDVVTSDRWQSWLVSLQDIAEAGIDLSAVTSPCFAGS